MVSIQVFVTQGNKIGWTSPICVALLVSSFVFTALFIRLESNNAHAFFNFKLFQNKTYAGATLSNFLLNGVAGTLMVSLNLMQLGGGMIALYFNFAMAMISIIAIMLTVPKAEREERSGKWCLRRCARSRRLSRRRMAARSPSRKGSREPCSSTMPS